MSKSFGTYGDLGDILYLCPSMKLVAEQTGEPVILYAKDGLRPWDPITARIPLIKDLLESQSYIHAVRPHNGEEIDFDATHFRRAGLPYGITLAQLQAQWLGLEPDLSWPWLSVKPEHRAPIIIARSPRYQNCFFPWRQLVKEFGAHMQFVGLDHEYVEFCREFGHVARLCTNDLHDVAKAIAGSDLFIGNQSSPYAVCEGLKHDSILEVSLQSVDCCYRRPNARFCYDGSLELTFKGRTLSTPAFAMKARATLNETPPGGWRCSLHGRTARSYAFAQVIDEIKFKLAQDGIPAPENLIETMLDQSSVDMPPPPVMVPIRMLQELLA
jgi:hypothetical protein